MEQMATALNVYTDGGCSGNPGPGAWAYVMVLSTFQGERKVLEEKRAEKYTTNNRMELHAVIAALRALKASDNLPRQATVYTDSQYVQKGITEWIQLWKRNSWFTSERRPVKNQDLWKELDALTGELALQWQWVKGHAGNTWNERCDHMVQEALAAFR
jgi:ribonuclease HI